MRITCNDLCEWITWYTDAKIKRICKNNEITPLEIRDLKLLSTKDRVDILILILFHRGNSPLTDFTGWCELREYFYKKHDYLTYRPRSAFPRDEMSGSAFEAMAFSTSAVRASRSEIKERRKHLDYLVELIGE